MRPTTETGTSAQAGAEAAAEAEAAPAGPVGRPDSALDLVTGAFGNTGRAITQLLTGSGRRVRTLTDHPPSGGAATGPAAGPAAGGPSEVLPYRFDEPARLVEAFAGVTTFYNTFWMRTGDRTGYETAVSRSEALLAAAGEAGVARVVQLSVAHPAISSPYPYFRAKARVERAARSLGAPVAIIRPALVFGGPASLLEDLAWLLRRVPVFAVAGDGSYRVRPVHVEDVARLCVEAGARRHAEQVDAVGPERPTYLELVRAVRDAVGSRALVVRAPAGVVLAAARGIGAVLREELLTRDELLSTMEGMADTDGPATGTVALTPWLREHGAELGRGERSRRRR